MQPSFTLGIGSLVGTSLTTHFRNLLPFTLLAAIAMAPWIATSFYLQGKEESIGLLATSSILQALGAQGLTGALTFSIVQQLRGEWPTFAQTILIGVQSLLRVLVLGIVVGVLVGIGWLVLIVPGIILTTCFYVAVPVTVLERQGIGASMRRSLELTRGNRWRVFGAALLFVLLLLGAAVAVGFLTAASGGTAELPLEVEIGLTVLLAPFGSTMPAVCYYMLRTGKENVDTKAIAAVFA